MAIPSILTPKDYNELYPRYLASEKAQKKSVNTLKAYDLSLRKFRDYLAKVNPEEITPLVVQEWTDSMLEADVSANSAGQYWDGVNRFFDWAIKMKLVSESPMPEDGKPDHTFTKKNIPEEDEIKRLLDPANIPFSIKGKLPFRNYTIVAFITLTGLRSDEVRELRLSDLDFENNTLTVRNGKGGKEREAPFPEIAQEIVKKYLDKKIRPSWAGPEDLLFGTHSAGLDDETSADETKWHKFDASTLGRLVKRYGKTVIGKEIHPHLLRHCATSIWADQGANIRDVQLALGHSNLATTERIYTHILNKKKAAQNVSSVLSSFTI